MTIEIQHRQPGLVHDFGADEVVTGSFMNPEIEIVRLMAEKISGIHPGFGIFSTNYRLFGVDYTKLASLKGYCRDEGTITPEILEHFKDFEIPKEDIKKIVMVKPGGKLSGLKWKYMQIFLFGGTVIEIAIATQRSFERILELMKNFLPEAVYLSDSRVLVP
jgi:hypothetical protein